MCYKCYNVWLHFWDVLYVVERQISRQILMNNVASAFKTQHSNTVFEPSWWDHAIYGPASANAAAGTILTKGLSKGQLMTITACHLSEHISQLKRCKHTNVSVAKPLDDEACYNNHTQVEEKCTSCHWVHSQVQI